MTPLQFVLAYWLVAGLISAILLVGLCLYAFRGADTERCMIEASKKLKRRKK